MGLGWWVFDELFLCYFFWILLVDCLTEMGWVAVHRHKKPRLQHLKRMRNDTMVMKMKMEMKKKKMIRRFWFLSYSFSRWVKMEVQRAKSICVCRCFPIQSIKCFQGLFLFFCVVDLDCVCTDSRNRNLRRRMRRKKMRMRRMMRRCLPMTRKRSNLLMVNFDEFLLSHICEMP